MTLTLNKLTMTLTFYNNSVFIIMFYYKLIYSFMYLLCYLSYFC